MLVFACLSPHAPIFLPTVGSSDDRQKVKSTITALESLAPKLAAAKPNVIIISSPHPDWGINVPAYFLLAQMKNEKLKIKNYLSPNYQLQITNYSPAIYPILTTLDSPKQHFKWGQQIISQIPDKLRVAWIASGDMSHTLKPDGPYGFNPAGPEFDQKFIDLLKKKDIEGILNLDSDSDWLQSAGQCGLNSFCMLLGALEETKTPWTPEILSYEGPFGVGYLVAQLV